MAIKFALCLICLVSVRGPFAHSGSNFRFYISNAIPQKDVKANFDAYRIVSVKSIVQCVSKCIDDGKCSAFNFKRKERMCELLDSYRCNSGGGLVKSPGYRYYDVEYNVSKTAIDLQRSTEDCLKHGKCSTKCKNKDDSEKSIIRKHCKETEECGGMHQVECRSSICQCLEGYSYDSRRQACYKECEFEGKTFTDVPGKYIQSNNRDATDAVSIEQCKTSCIKEQLFKCVSIDYNISGRQCYLADVVMSMVGADKWKSDSDYIYLQRDCI